ncbi:uncharacterized protein [Ptychodera flava]|uniref:uncharacterized protein n=1 Tax=Ptychodera flava TaxID=63121 RepID=UPI00396A5725
MPVPLTARDFEQRTVPDLKDFLQKRGVTVSNYRKQDLVKLCVAAATLDVQPIDRDDSEELSRIRRTVKVGDGSGLVDDHRRLKRWSGDLSTMPDVSLPDVLIWLKTGCNWTSERLRKHEQDKGYLLYKGNHIYGVTYAATKHRHFYIKSLCIRQEKQKESPYEPWVLVSKDGEVVSGGCTCVADNGTCKHCVALLFSLYDWCSRHKDRHTEVGTDIQCKWDRPRKETRPQLINDIDIRHKQDIPRPPQPTHDEYQPGLDHPNMTNSEFRQAVFNLCTVVSVNENIKTCFMETLDPMTDSAESVDKPKTINQLVSDYKQSKSSSFSNFLKENTSKNDIDLIEKLTQGQSSVSDWFEYRKGRLTASKFHAICHCSAPRFPKLLQDIFEEKDMNFAPVQYGIQNESVAKQIYYDEYCKNPSSEYSFQCKNFHRNNVDMVDSGLVCYDKYPFIAASPDAKVICKICGEIISLVEIKCCWKYRHSDPLEAAKDTGYRNVYLDNRGVFHLNKSSAWFTQIQGQLTATGLHFCDFVFFTSRGIVCERIFYDDIFSESTFFKKLCTFFDEYVVPKLTE